MPNITDVLKRTPEPRKGAEGASDPGPRNRERDRQNPDLLAPPETDEGTLPNLKFSFSDAHNRLEKGGWAREVTARELPVAKALAGVNMRLKPGAVRELHWHKQAEWSYMLVGSARITAIDQNGHNFIDDIGVGDLWYFPPGIPHSIQGLKDGCEFLLVFNDGNFSEGGTFLITDWFAHTPKEVLSANFGVPEREFSEIPHKELYIYQGTLPGPIETEQVQDPVGPPPVAFSHRLVAQQPLQSSGGTVRIADSTNFPVSKQIAAALVEIEPGAMRELHWHPNADEWQYYLEGRARMTVFASESRARTFDFQEGDVGYVPFAMGHYIQNVGNSPVRMLEMFASDHFADISLNQWMALTPPSLIREHLKLGRKAMESLRKEKQPVVRF
jgi:oxalate decarboxylase